MHSHHPYGHGHNHSHSHPHNHNYNHGHGNPQPQPQPQPHSQQNNSCEIELTITHANGVMSNHHYMVPSDNNVQLVCTNINNNQKTIYPLVQIQNRPVSGQSSTRIPRNYRPPGAAPGAATLSSHRAHIREQAARQEPPPHIPVSPPPGFAALPIPNRLDVPPTLILNSSNGQLFRWTSSTQSGETVVGMQQHPMPIPQPQPLQQQPPPPPPQAPPQGAQAQQIPVPPPQKRGPYMCQRCGEVFEISQALAAHVNNHYRTEETLEQRKARQAAKNKRKRDHDHPRKDYDHHRKGHDHDHDHDHDHEQDLRLGLSTMIVSPSSSSHGGGTMRDAGPSRRKETTGESSNSNMARDHGKKVKQEHN